MNKLFTVLKKYPKTILIFVSLLLYMNTLTHEYALDDAIVITQNDFVKKGIDGIGNILSTESFTGFFGYDKQLVAGGRYRPLSLITFAVEYELFGLQPTISHLINVLLYICVVLLIFILFNKSGRVTTFFALGVALLYAIHPIHTEVVANIKGRDEILAFLFALLAAYLTLYPLKNKILSCLGIMLTLFLGVMSKEHVVSFVVLIPLIMYYLRHKNKDVLWAIVWSSIPVIVFILIRFSVLDGMQINESSDLMNNPFVYMDFGERLATIFYTWFIYLKLLIIPHPLTYDYYPFHIATTNFISVIPWIVVFWVLIAIFFAVQGLIKRKIYSYWIWFFVGTFILMSNLFFSIGTFMNERFMFISSLSIVVLMVFALQLLYVNVRFRNLVITLCLLLVVGYSVKAISRNLDWKNDFTLFTHDIQTSQESAKGNCVAGGQWYEKGAEEKDKILRNKFINKAQGYLRKAIKIYPTYNDAHLLLGNALFGIEKPLDTVMPHYLSIFSRSPKHTNAWRNSLIILQSGDVATRLKWYKKLEAIDSTKFDVLYNMGVIYGRYMNKYDQSEKYLKKALSIKPNNIVVMRDLAVVYGMTHRFQESIEVLLQVVKKEPEDATSWYNLGISYNALKIIDSAQVAFDRSHQLDSLRPKVVLKK